MTTNTTRTAIYVTNRDLGRLEELLATTAPTRCVEELDDELGRAVVVPSEGIPADVVTMNSLVRFRDDDTGVEEEIRLVYPRDADASRKHISIFAPVGVALLGQKVGETVRWRMPFGKERSLTILAVPFQPEAAGRFEL